jgi:OOP family OmpA-OmpF porin
VLQDDRIEILDNVYFRTNSHRIERRSYPLLDNIAAVLAAHPEIALLSIEGHTDSRGRPANNLRLSQRRARSVMDYLRRKGIDRARLQSEGYGQTARSSRTPSPRKTSRATAASSSTSSTKRSER